MKTKWIVAIVVTVVVALLGLMAIAVVLVASMGRSGAWGPRQIALIHLSGPIAASSQEDMIGDSTVASPERLIPLLRRADDDSSVRAILLRVNSPGGTAAASQEIAEEVRRTSKPVIISVADIDASGAYMISTAADKIVAAPASDVGSIGVILQLMDLQRLADKMGVGVTVIKQGKYKDMGNPFRRLSPAERRILDADSKIVYEQFIGEVARGRKLPISKVRKLASGRTWIATEARELGLIDEIGNFQDAIDLAARMGKIKGRPNVVQYDTPSLAGFLSRALSAAIGNAAIGTIRGEQLGDLSRRLPARY